MLRMSVKKAVGRITAGIAAVILVAGGAGFVGQPAWAAAGQPTVTRDYWMVTGDPEGWNASDGTLKFTKPGKYTVERMGGNDCRITAGDLGASPGLELTMGDVDCSGNAKDPGFNGGNTLVTLKLRGTTKLQGGEFRTAGIWARTDKPGLVITSADGPGKVSGRLEATGGDQGAGIGGRGWRGETGGKITIEGGTVIAKGGDWAAGIGGGYQGDGSNIRISGGTVTATADEYGAGIGGGYQGDGSNIEVSGGTVTVTGDIYGAGIGGGYEGDGSNIEVSGGTVTAATGRFGVNGIGGGHRGSASDITVSGGSVKASRVSSPKDQGGQDVELTTIPAQIASGHDEIMVDGKRWTRSGGHPVSDTDTDDAWYAWLPPGVNHRVTVGSSSICVYWRGGQQKVLDCAKPEPKQAPAPRDTPILFVNTHGIRGYGYKTIQPQEYGEWEIRIREASSDALWSEWRDRLTIKDLRQGGLYEYQRRYAGNDQYWASDPSSPTEFRVAPEVAVPFDLTGTSGQPLSTVSLSKFPEFTWADTNQTLTQTDRYRAILSTDGLPTSNEIWVYGNLVEQETSCTLNPEENATVCKTPVTVSAALNEISSVSVQGADGDGQVEYSGKPVVVEHSVKHEPLGGFDAGQVKYRYESTDGKGYDSDAAPLTAGKYRVSVTVPEFTDARRVTYAAVSQDYEFSIVPGKWQSVEPPVVKAGLVFDGTAQQLLETAGSAAGRDNQEAVFEYAVTEDDVAKVEDVPEKLWGGFDGVKASNAGDYKVWWRVVPDGNHTAISGDVQVKVAAAQPTVSAKPAHAISFGQKFADADVTVTATFDGKPIAGSTEWAETDRDLSTGSQEFNGLFTPADTRNFVSAPVRVIVQVDQVPAVVTGLEAAKDLVYTGKEQALVTTPTAVGGTMVYAVGSTRPADDSQDWSRDLPKVTDAGDYTVFWRVVPDGNHTSIGGDVQVKVAAAQPKATAQPARVITFGQRFVDAGVTVDAVFDGQPVEGTTQWTGTDRELTAGTHKFTGIFTPKDTKNFTPVPVTVTVQVEPVPAVFNGLEAVKDLVFTGAPQTLVTIPAVTGGAVEYAVGSSRPADDAQAWSKELPKAVDAGDHTVFWRVVPDGNHTSIGGEVTVNVAAAEPTVTAKPAREIRFGQTFADAGVAVSAELGGKPVEGAVEWTGVDGELSAGTHEFTGRFTPKDAKNLKPVPVRVTVEVEQIPAGVTGLEAERNLVFSGKPQALVTTTAVTGGTVEYAVAATRPADDSHTWSRDLPKVTDAGDYTVFWRVVPDGNHTSIGGEVTVNVAAAQPKATAQPAHAIRFGQTFADAGVTVSAELGGKIVEGTAQWVDADRELTLGTHEFTGTFTPKDTKNFIPVPVTVTVQVGKAPAMVSGLEAVGNLVFTGQPQALVTPPTVVGGAIEYAVGKSQPSSEEAWESTLPVGSHAGAATVFWRVVPDGNHTEVHGQVPVTIAPKVAGVDGQLAYGFSFAAEQGEYVVRDGQTRLTVGSDYSLELVNASFETQTADVEITFAGDYTGFAVVKNAMATEWGGVGVVEWKPGSGDVSLDLGEDAAPVTGVQVDDKPLPEGTFHRTDDGKLVVDSSVLEGLTTGNHTLEVRLEDGSVIVYPIRVLPADKPAPLFTGEWLAWLLTWPILLWMVLRTFAPWMLPFFLR